ncbi:hypothetical protein J6590_032426 [Homalodisca vitripennis]|nr:hypothetical protein J6590_032426 [Homalodisca vitripennis]
MVRSSGRRCDPVWRVCGSGGRQGGVEEAHRRGKESTEICYAPARTDTLSDNDLIKRSAHPPPPHRRIHGAKRRWGNSATYSYHSIIHSEIKKDTTSMVSSGTRQRNAFPL